MTAEDFSIRRMTEGDIAFGMALDEIVGWNQVVADWVRFLRYQPDGCFVGMLGGKPVGTISTTCYGTEMAWIGMVLVHPDHRRKGIATALMKHALAFLDARGTQCVKLDATPAGAMVYEQLGFIREWDFHRYQKDGKADQESLAVGADGFAPPLSDREAFGVNRDEWVMRLAEGSRVEQYQGGYGMLRPGRLATYLGPVMAQQTDTAQVIIERLLERTKRTVLWDVPGPNEAAMKMAKRWGFTPVRPLTRMWRGSKLIHGNVAWQYAMGAPATG